MTITAGASGLIPQSSALTEASELSLNELTLRDPESLSEADWDRVIKMLREQRERYEKLGEARAAGKKTKQASAGAGKPTQGVLDLNIDPENLF